MAAAGRPIVAQAGPLGGSRQPIDQASSAAQAKSDGVVRRRSHRGRRRPSAPGGRGPPRPWRAGRRPSRDRVGFGFDVTQRQVDVQRRGEDLGGQTGWGCLASGSSVAKAQIGVRRTPA